MKEAGEVEVEVMAAVAVEEWVGAPGVVAIRHNREKFGRCSMCFQFCIWMWWM